MKRYEDNGMSNTYTRHLIKGNVTGNLGINSAMRFSAIYGEGVDRIEVLRKIRKENTFRFWWYIIFGIMAIICLAIWPSSWISCIEIFVLMINIDLVSRGKVVGIYIGILDCLIYIVVCSLSGLWGEVIKTCCVNIPLNIVAIIGWTKNIKAQSKNQSKTQTIEIKRLRAKDYAIWITVFVVTAVVGYFGLGLLHTTSLVISCISLAIGVLSKALSSLRYMESYIISMIGNIINLSLWVSVIFVSFGPNVPIQALMTLASLASNCYSYFLWKDMYRKEHVNGGKLFARRNVKINKVIKLRRMYKNLYWDKDVDISKNS